MSRPQEGRLAGRQVDRGKGRERPEPPAPVVAPDGASLGARSRTQAGGRGRRPRRDGERPLAERRHVARLCLDVGVALLATAGRLVGLGLHVRQDVTRGRPPQAPSDKGLFDASVLPGASPRLPGLRCRRPGMTPAPAAGTPGRPSPRAWNCGSRAPVLMSSLFWRLRELVWVGGCVTTPAMWASPPGRRTQECTQIGGNGLSGPLWGIRVHCCAVGLGCGWPWDRNSVHKWEDRASPRRIGAFVYTIGLLRCCEQPWGRRSVHKSERTRHLDGSPTVCVHYRPAGRTARASAAQNSPYHLFVTTGTATRHSEVRPRRRFHAMWLLARSEGACSPSSSPSR